MSDTSVIRVAVVDDDPAFLDAAVSAISACDDMSVVGAGASFAAGLSLLKGPAADVLVVDLGLPDGSGVDLIAHARRVWPDCNTMVATIFGDEAHIFAALEAGATGYVLKDSAPTELSEEIRSLRAGGSPISPLIARRILAHFAVAPRAPASTGALDTLSSREEAVLALITQGFSQAEVANQLDISTHTVRNFVRRIYLKLGVTTRTGAISAARKAGLR